MSSSNNNVLAEKNTPKIELNNIKLPELKIDTLKDILRYHKSPVVVDLTLPPKTPIDELKKPLIEIVDEVNNENETEDD